MTESRSRLAARWERHMAKLDRLERSRERKLPGWRTTRHRRRVVAFTAFGDLLLIGGAVAFPFDPAWIFLTLWIAGWICAMGGFVLLRILTGRITGSFTRLLDERDREWRSRIMFVGFQTVVGLMMIAMFYGLAVAGRPDSGLRTVTMLAALLVTGASVPTAVLGWTLPDDDPEDFEEGERK